MEERRYRKKAQNRLNQRAHRQRMRQKRPENGGDTPFTVTRWRLDDDQIIRSATAPSRHVGLSRTTARNILSCQPSELASCIERIIGTEDPCIGIASRRLETALSLSADHLIHLVHFNVFRGLVLNKRVIAKRAEYFVPTSQQDTYLLPYVEDVYPGEAVLVPTNTDADTTPPTALDPTQLQASIPHSVWINLLPFPTWRDSLIRWANSYNHAELVGDIIGNLIDLKHFPRAHTGRTEPPIVCGMTMSPENIDESTTSRNGLILWGEPHIADNWEFTAGFLRKWGWTLRGCEHFIESTNRWRAGRGEEPIHISPCT